MSQKPNVLIFGGLDRGTSTVLVQHLLPPFPAEPLVSFVRFVDKYSIDPPTTYVPKDFLKLVNERKGVIEYRQANLTNPTVVTQCFRPSADGRPFTHVFDCSGSYSLTDIHEIQIVHTFIVSLNLAREAAHQQLKAYVRITPSFYDHRDERDKFTEEEVRGWVPLDVRGVWFHEAIRAIGSLPGLPLVVLRHGQLYGPGMVQSERVTAIVLGKVYKETKRHLNIPVTRNLRKNTIHLQDLAAAVWLSAEWISSMTRETADSIAGVRIPPSGSADVANVADAVQSSTATVAVPLFNVVDGSDMTQEGVTTEVSKAFEVVVTHSPDRLPDEQYYELIEDVNGDNYGHWSEIINNSNPPVPNTPLSPCLTVKDLQETGTALDGSKIRQVSLRLDPSSLLSGRAPVAEYSIDPSSQILSFSPKYPRFGAETIQQYISWCEAEGIWPK